MTYTYVESRINETSNVELLQSYLTAFFHLALILHVFCSTGSTFHLLFYAYTTRFEFYFGTKYPLRVELIIECQHETRNSYRASVFTGITVVRTRKTVLSIIHKAGYHLTVSAETEFLIIVSIIGLFDFRLRLSLYFRCCSYLFLCSSRFCCQRWQGCQRKESCSQNNVSFCFHCFLLIFSGAKLETSKKWDNTQILRKIA